MTAYKKDRYGGWLGGLRWAKDKLLGMPEKVNEFYAAGRELYLKQMDGVISGVADLVATDLTAAKKRIATGRTEIATYVKSLPADLQKVGSEASKEIGDRFTHLESDVDAKQEAVVDTLATKYVEARKGLDERIEALQKPITKALDFVIKTGLKLAGPIIRGIKGISGKVKAKVAAGKAWVKGKVEAGKQWAKGVKHRITGGGKDGPSRPDRKSGGTAALADADRLLSAHPDHATAVSKVATISKQYGTPLRLVVESRAADGERVHVQTMQTPSHTLPVAAVDAATQAKLDAARLKFAGIITGFGGDATRAEGVCTYRPAAGAPASAVDDFLRDAERAGRVISNLGVPSASKAAVQLAAADFAFRRRGTAGAPGEFANVVEYFMTHWMDRYLAEQARQEADVAAGVRRQTDRSEAARVATAAMNPDAVGNALYRDRARVEKLGRTGATASSTLTDAELVSRNSDALTCRCWRRAS